MRLSRYALMGLMDVALATSGTVVMEAALMGLPAVVLYRLSPLSYFIGRLLVHVEHSACRTSCSARALRRSSYRTR